MIPKIALSIILILSAVGIQSIVGWIVKTINNQIKETFEKLEKHVEKLNSIIRDPKKINLKDSLEIDKADHNIMYLIKNGRLNMLEDFQKEHFNFALILKKKESVGYITKVVGYFELALFAGLTVLLIKFTGGGSVFMGFREFAILAGGWIALKIFGGYQQWSGAVLGRAYFYNFLVGSIANIMLAAAIGFVFAMFVL